MAEVSSTVGTTTVASSAPTTDTSTSVPTSDTSTVGPTTSTGPTTSAEPTTSPSATSATSAPADSPVAASSNPASSASASASGGASTSAGGTSASTTSQAGSTTSQVVQTSYVVQTVTDGSGNLVTTSAPVTVTSSVVSSSGSSGGSSNTGAIVGGVVGGVVGLILIAGLLWFFLRKRRRSHRDDFDDNMFDPNRAQNHGPIDLADPGTNTVEPFYTPGVASTAQSPQMTQYPGSAATSEGYGAQGLSRGPSTATSAGLAGQGAGFATMQMPEPHVGGGGAGYGGAAAAGVGAGAVAGMSAKQREAYHERQRNRVGGPAAQPYGQGSDSGPSAAPMSPSGTHSSDGPVTVAEDAGAWDAAHPSGGSEVPPTYDSIPRR